MAMLNKDKVLDSYIKLFSKQTLILVIITTTATFFCYKNNVSSNISPGLLGVAIIFPVAFAINASYVRREKVLSHINEIRSNAYCICMIYDIYPRESILQKVNVIFLVEQFLESLILHCNSDTGRSNASFDSVVNNINAISICQKQLSKTEVPGPILASANKAIVDIYKAVGGMNIVLNYRTSKALRSYTTIFLNVIPVILVPYYCYIGSNHIIGYMLAVLYPIILAALDNIQEDLEDPLDSIGIDDIKLEEEFRRIR
jgi:hypothetical protein